MATTIPEPPKGGADAVRDAAGDLLPGRFPNRAHADVKVDVHPPIAVLNLGLDALREGGGLDAAQFAGWRHLVSVGDAPVALADVDETSGAPEVRQFNYGPFVASVARNMGRVGQVLEREGGEVRLLQVPALYVLALWHDRGDGRGTVTPLDPAPPPFEPGRPYDEAEFLDLLRKVAEAAGPEGSALPEPEPDGEPQRPPRPRR